MAEQAKNPYDQFKKSSSPKPKVNPYDQFKDPYTSIYKQGVQSSAIYQEQFDEGVDYETGVPDFGFRADLSRMDTAEERGALLDKKVGKNNWDIDSYGRYILWPEGMAELGIKTNSPTAIDEVSLSRYDVADLRGDAPAIVGAVAGGMASTGVGILPAAGLVGLTSMGAKGLDEAADSLRGENLQSANEVAGDVLKEGALASVGEGVFRAVAPAGRYIMAPGQTQNPLGATFQERMKQRLLDPPEKPRPKVSPERVELTESALEMGAIPSVFQASERSLTGRIQGMIESIFGPNAYRTKTNMEAINTRAGELSDRAPGPGGSGRKARLTLSRKLASARNAFEQAEKNIERQAKENISKARAQVSSGNSVAAADSIKESKRIFDEDMGALYAQVDELIGGAEVVSSQPMKDMARKILDELPQTEDGGRAFISPSAAKQLKDIINLSDKMTFQQAQRARTVLREAAENPDILSNISSRDLTRLKLSVDRALDPDADFLVNGKNLVIDSNGLPRLEDVGIPVPEAKAAADMLKQAGKAYAGGIRLYDDELVKRIARDPSVAGAIPPSKVAETVARSDPSVIQNLKSVVSLDAWSTILDEHLEGLYVTATKPDGTLNAASMLNNINRMGERFGAMYGERSPEVRNLIREAAAKNADINLNGLNQASDMTKALQEGVKRRAVLDDMMGSDRQFIKKIDEGSLTDDQIVDYVFRSGKGKNPELLRSVRNTLGKDSQEWAGIRRKAMGSLLEHMERESDDAVTTLLNGAGLDDAIKSYGSENMSIMFGKELAEDLTEFARTVKFLSSQKSLSGGIVAANIALHPAANMGKLAYLNVLGRILSSRGTIRYFTEGLKAPKTRAGAAAMTRAVIQMQGLIETDEHLPEIQP